VDIRGLTCRVAALAGLLLAATSLVAGGCATTDLWEPAGLPAGAAPGRREAGDAGGTGRPSAGLSPARQVQNAKVEAVWLLFLVRPSVEVPTGPSVRRVVLRHVAPGRAAWVLAWITEPVGFGGSDERQFLVFRDPAVWRWAGQMCPVLDVPAVSGSERADRQGFAVCLGRLYGSAVPNLVDPAVAESVVESAGGRVIGCSRAVCRAHALRSAAGAGARQAG